ncbi:MAG: hypothetical protein ACRDHG_11610 [Anaerolineales bacterium]
MRDNAHLLQESLLTSLRTDPLLIRAEELIHSAQPRETQELLEDNLARLLEPGLAIAEIDRRQYRPMDSGMIARFRAAMETAVAGGANLADAEGQILESFGLSKVGELRAAMQTHLEAPPELPEQTLAIYVPKGDRKQEDFHRALQRDLQALETALEQPDEDPAEAELQLAPTVEADPEPNVIAEPPPVPAAAEPVDVDSDLRVTLGLAADRQRSEAKGLAKLNPIPMLTAALEAVGLGGEGFGFVLRYGRYASQGRKSEFLVGGLGLADLSKRLTTWLDAQGPLEGQVQVIDEGSGELTVYLLLPEAA